MTEETPDPDRPANWLVALMRWLEVDRAVFYALIQRGWQFLAGPITFLLIATFFSKPEQGFYVTFWTIIGLQTFFELAIPQTIIVTASHLWEKLELGDGNAITGDEDARSQLTHLVRVSMLIYLGIAVAFGLVVGTFGLFFFARDSAAASLEWRLPWLSLIFLSSLIFALIPLVSVLEGCGQVREVYKLQAGRAVLGNLVVWIAIPLGAGLWAPALASLVRLACEVFVLFVTFRRFFAVFLKPPAAALLDWKKEVWPFQSRAVIKGFFGYLNADLMGPVIFHFHGSVAAGAFGMTWNILNSLRGACGSWVRTRLPSFGVLVAKKDYVELDRVFLRVSVIGLSVMALALGGFVAFVGGLALLDLSYADRLLSPLPSGLLALGLLAALVVEFIWTYVHAHRSSPYLLLTVLGTLVSGALIVVLGKHFAAVGVASAFFFVNAILYLPMSTWAWFLLRDQWHAEDAHMTVDDSTESVAETGNPYQAPNR